MSCTSTCYGCHEFYDEDEDELPIVSQHSLFPPILTHALTELLWGQLQIKETNECYLYHQLLLNYIDRKSNTKHYAITLCRLIQMSYRNNKFTDSIRYYKTVWRMINSKDTFFLMDICSLRISCFLLFQSRAPECMVINLLQNQRPRGSIDIRQNDDNEIMKLRVTIFRHSVYLYMNHRINFSSTSLLDHANSATNLLELWQNAREKVPACFTELYDINGYIGYYHSICKHDLLNACKYFINPMLEMMTKRNFECNNCCNSLCIDKNLLLCTFSIHLTFTMSDYKMANYMYKIAIKHNPFDPTLLRYYGILLMHCGKYKKALKYLKKSKKTNPDACITELFSPEFDSNKSYIQHAIDKIKCFGKSIPSKDIEFWFDVCFNCGDVAKRMKRCKKCRIASYCTRKCQKLHWKKHRNHCKSKDLVTMYDRMHYYLLRDAQLLER